MQVWILLLYLIAAGGEKCKVGTMGDMFTGLKIEYKAGSELLRQAGVVCKKGGGVGAQLKVPVVFPGPKRGKA
jgi:hypothetical protein